MQEDQLIIEVQNGSQTAYRLLIKKYEKLVFHVACRIIDNQEDLEDICQEVFIKVYKNIQKFKGDSKLSTWIATIAYHTSVNHLKRRKNNTYSMDNETSSVMIKISDSHNIENIIDKKERNEVLKSAIANLPDKYKTILSLYHVEEFSYKEIEDITGLPEGTVKNYIFRARKLLKEILIKQKDYDFSP